MYLRIILFIIKDKRISAKFSPAGSISGLVIHLQLTFTKLSVTFLIGEVSQYLKSDLIKTPQTSLL